MGTDDILGISILLAANPGTVYLNDSRTRVYLLTDSGELIYFVNDYTNMSDEDIDQHIRKTVKARLN